MKELPQRSLPPESFPKKAARFALKKAIHTLPASVLIFAACSGGSVAEKNNNQELKDKESSGYALPFPEGETWFLTNGPHADGYSGIKNAIDIAPPEVINCVPGDRIALENRAVTASASGKVIIKGDDNNRNDPYHSEIRIQDKQGLTVRYIHLDNTKVKKGDKVKQGQALGNPSCEFPPGGANTGIHVHVGLRNVGQAIPIDGTIIGGWTIHEGVGGKDGTMTKPGETTRTANTGRYADGNGTRNDLPNNPNRAVVAGPKSPIPPIYATITPKEVFIPTATPPPTAIPTPKPTETKKPATIEKQPKTLEEQAKAVALGHFLYSLYTPRSETNRDSYGKTHKGSLKPNIVNRKLIDGRLEGFPVNEIVQDTQATDSDYLLLTWKYIIEGGPFCPNNWGQLYPGGPMSPAPQPFTGNVGQGEIKNFKLSSGSFLITGADRANGIQWKGQVGLRYIVRSKLVVPFFPTDYGTHPAHSSHNGPCGSSSAEEWAKVAVEPSGPFTDWRDAATSFQVELRNGQWRVDNCYLGGECKPAAYPLTSYHAGAGENNVPCQPIFGWGPVEACEPLYLK